jgi:hypothetical protein
MPPKPHRRTNQRGRSTSPRTERLPPPPAKREKKDSLTDDQQQQQQQQQQQVPLQQQQNKDTSEQMEVEPMTIIVTSTLNPDNQQNHNTIPPVSQTNIDNDQANDASENFISDQSNAIIFDKETDASTFFAFYDAATFFPETSIKEKINTACEIFNGCDYTSFIGASLKTLPQDKTKKIIRIGFATRADFEKATQHQIPKLNNTTFLPLDRTPIAKYVPELSIRITEIPISTTESNLRSSFSIYGKICKCSMNTKNLWQQATITYETGTDMTPFDHIEGYFVLKDMVRLHRCNLKYDDIRQKSKFSMKLTNLPIDTTSRELIPIGKAINAMAWIVPKSK